jgi:hypothetical protein
VDALIEHRGQVIAGGNFVRAEGKFAPGVAQWNGSAWVPFPGAGILGTVYGLKPWREELIALVSLVERGFVVDVIAAFDGEEWRVLGDALFGGHAFVLSHYGDRLIVGGWFTDRGAVPLNHIAQWEGDNWQPMGDGFNSLAEATIVYDGNLIVGGDFTASGATDLAYLAKWNGTEWEPFAGGTNAAVWSLCEFEGKLIAGGKFTSAGGVPASRIASWDGQNWQPMGDGFDGPVNILTIHEDRLVAGGWFAKSGGTPALGVARWDGERWQPMGDGFSDIPIEFFVSGGTLYAAGRFEWSGGTRVNHIARWSGTQWVALGDGTGATVYALAEFDNGLFVGGDFLTAGGKPSVGIARWNEDKTPVALELQEGMSTETGILLNWTLASDVLANVQQITVERASDRAGPYTTIATLQPTPHGSFHDSSAERDREYWYRVSASSEDGVVYSRPVRVSWGGRTVVDLRVSLDRDTREYTIEYDLPAADHIRLDLFDVRGRRIPLLAGYSRSGRVSAHRSTLGLSRGVYFVRLETSFATRVRRLTLMR